jgi:DNA-binding NtrC family response regulator
MLPSSVSLHEAVSAFKRRLILEALSRFDGNRSRAAAALGIERTSLLRLIRDLEIDEAPQGHCGRPPSAALTRARS